MYYLYQEYVPNLEPEKKAILCININHFAYQIVFASSRQWDQLNEIISLQSIHAKGKVCLYLNPLNCLLIHHISYTVRPTYYGGLN